jgi:heme exporter protein A
MMTKFSVAARDIRKDFNRRVVFKHISFELSSHESLSITGPNGSGKSTLVKILSGLLTPTTGSVSMTVEDSVLKSEQRRAYIGFVAPYLQLYDEFTGSENLLLAIRIRGSRGQTVEAEGLLKRVGLLNCRDDRVGTYSSGMKQRLKYAFALLHKPALLVLDEHMSNLDEAGIQAVRELIEEQKQIGIVVVATNDADEARMCGHNLDLNTAKTPQLVAFS